MKEQKTRIFLRNAFFILVILAAVCFLFQWYTRANQRRIREQNLNYALDSARQNARHVEDELDAALKQIRSASQFLGLLLEQPDVSAEILQAMESTSIFDALRFTDAKGITYASDGDAADSSDRDFYLNGMKGESGVSVIFDSRITGENQMNFYTPVRCGNQIVGVLRGVFSAEKYLQEMLVSSYFGEPAEVFLCISDGTVIASYDGLTYDRPLPDVLVDEGVIDAETAANMRNAFRHRRGERAFYCGEDSSVDNLCVIGLSNSDYILVQTFPRSVTYSMLSNANYTGLVLQAALLGMFCFFILLLFTWTKSRRRILEQENRQLDYIRRAVNSIFSQYILVDLEADTYEYLSETKPSRIDFPTFGRYADFPAYVCSFLINEEDCSVVLTKLSPEKIIANLGESNTVLQYEYPVIRGSKPEWIHASIICLERKDGKASKVLFLWQDISYLKEKERRAKAEIARVARSEQHYITATLASAFCTYEVNLTRARVERVSFSSHNNLIRTQLDPERVGRLEAITLKNPIPFHVWRDIWKDFISDDSLEEYFAWADISHFLNHFEQGETESVIEYWTKPTKDGVCCIRESCYMMRDEETDDMLGLVIAKDITSQVNQRREQIQALQEALKQAQRANNAKSVFLSNMSHDVRTPMNAIMGFTNIAVEHIDDRGQVKHCLEKVLSSSNHLLRLLNDILDMSHIESGQMQLTEAPCSLPTLFRDMFNVIQPQARAKAMELSVNTWRVINENIITDPLKFCQIFINLLGNAVKYTQSGGNVTFEISQRPSFDEGYGDYVFVVRDNGIGMSPDFLNYLFEPFERESTVTKTGIRGAGLGLTITKHIVDLMGGTIEVQSQKGKGSEFRVELKIKLQEKQPDAGKHPELDHLPIMVVADNPDSRNSICELLQQLGAYPEYAADVKNAVSRANAVLQEGASRPLYILNWQSPEMDCVAAAGEILEAEKREVSILIVTAYDWTNIEKEAREAGVTAFCEKPLFASNMMSTLMHMVHPMEEGENAKSVQPDFNGKRVLFVEDNELNREIAQMILTEAGFLVDTANDGTEAVEIMRKAEEFYYDAILSDIQMPIMNGFEAATAIRALPRKDVQSMPIIAMTANTSEEDRTAALESGMNYLIAKPLDVELFISVLGKFLT